MKKSIYIGAVLVIVLAVAAFLSKSSIQKVYPSYEVAEYVIDGKPVVLGTNGTTYFGDEATGDLNHDGKSDVGFIFTTQPGGSGTFYYVAAALGANGGYIGTNAILLGDRIAPQAVMIQDGGLLVSYATRKDNEPMTTTPHVMVSSFYQLQKGALVYKGSR